MPEGDSATTAKETSTQPIGWCSFNAYWKRLGSSPSGSRCSRPAPVSRSRMAAALGEMDRVIGALPPLPRT